MLVADMFLPSLSLSATSLCHLCRICHEMSQYQHVYKDSFYLECFLIHHSEQSKLQDNRIAETVVIQKRTFPNVNIVLFWITTYSPRAKGPDQTVLKHLPTMQYSIFSNLVAYVQVKPLTFTYPLNCFFQKPLKIPQKSV